MIENGYKLVLYCKVNRKCFYIMDEYKYMEVKGGMILHDNFNRSGYRENDARNRKGKTGYSGTKGLEAANLPCEVVSRAIIRRAIEGDSKNNYKSKLNSRTRNIPGNES